MGLFIAHFILSMGLVVMGWFVMTKSAVIGLMTELLAVLYFVLAIVLIIATAVALYKDRKIQKVDAFGSEESDTWDDE